jgi:S-DNA-T family DNA segregation ATPase FtsK/SpoIIIE
MTRSHLLRSTFLFVAAAAWVFSMLALASFHATDWPSHAVFPYPPIANACGPVGAFVAYYAFEFMGQGVFPLLFFTGVCLAMMIYQSKVTDLWLRVIGSLLLCIAFSATIHHFNPGSSGGFPEGNGGIVGIAAATYLQATMHTVGTRLVLLLATIIGLLLAADELVLQAPAAVAFAASSVKNAAPNVPKLSLPSMPKLPSRFSFMPKFPSMARMMSPEAGKRPARATPVAKPKAIQPAAKSSPAKKSDEEDEISKPNVLLTRATPATSAAASNGSSASASRSASALTSMAGAASDDHSEVDRSSEDEDAEFSPTDPWGVSGADDDSDAQSVDLDYPDDEPAVAIESAHVDASDPAPSEPAIVPPQSEQAVPPAPRADIIVKLPNMLKPRQVSPPTSPPKELGEYHLPPWDCLANADHGFAEGQEKFVREQAAILEQALKEFDIDAHVVEIDTGPVITMYEISLAPGIKVSTITGLSNDIMRSLRAESVRIVAPVPGKNTVGIEVPNAQKEKVRFKELLELAPEAAAQDMAIPLFLGKDASGEPLITDLTKMPHCLIAGTTGSGKSVCINTIIMSIMYLQRPDMVKLILVDPKVVEMAPFKDVPHLMCPVINDSGRATSVLEWACEKMDERYEFLAEAGVRNIKGYNQMSREDLLERFKPETPEEEAKIPKHLPYIVIIIDELADLMMTSGKEVEASIVRLAQKSRAVGIHLILATQRPQANVVTGLIKSNMPSRIAFRVASKMDSRIVLDQNGADLLLGQGDMLFMPPGASKPIRSQGTYIDDKEIRESVKLVRGLAEAQYEPELVQIKATVGLNGEMEKDELFDDAVRVVLETKRGSVSLLQRRLTIGYARASRLIEMMAATGIVGDYKGSQAREAMLTLEEWEAMKAQQIVDADSGMTV